MNRINVRHTYFLILSVVLFCSIMLYVWVYSQIAYRHLLASFEQSSTQSEYAFRAEQDATEMSMLLIAIMVANDSKAQQLFLQGKRAVEAEGGGAGGPQAAKIRHELYEHLRVGRDILAHDFGFRQLHFHFGPGSLSFLRVHCPEKFGDRLDTVRYTIVAANAELKNTSGFETGRVVSGIRGVTPVFAVDDITGEKIHVGALEAGTSFANMLSVFHNNHPWLNAAVLLSHQHLQANLWPQFLNELIHDGQYHNGFLVDASSAPLIERFMQRYDFNQIIIPGHHLLRDGSLTYSVTTMVLRDFRGKNDPSVSAAGVIIIWKDVSTAMAEYRENIVKLAGYGILLFALVELLMFYGLRRITTSLQNELEHTRELEIANENARIIAEESSRVKTEFLTTIGHELRTPLNAIVGLGQLVSNSNLDNKQQDYVAKINHAAKRLLNIINEILLITEIEAHGTANWTGQKFNLFNLVQRVLSVFSQRVQERRVDLVVDHDDAIPTSLYGFPAQLENVLKQIIGNAIKFGHDGQIIISIKLLKVDADLATVKFSVDDNGIGISNVQQQMIFKPFAQVDSTKNRQYEGTGLGLTIAQKVCQQLGSTVVVNSELGRGAQFSFVLPFKIVDNPAPASLAMTDNQVTGSMNQPVDRNIITLTVLDQLLTNLEKPLLKMQPTLCKQVVVELKNQQYPPELKNEIEQLLTLVDNYRFAEAAEVLFTLKQLLNDGDV